MPSWVFGAMILFGSLNVGWLFLEDRAAAINEDGLDIANAEHFDKAALGMLGGMVFFGIIGEYNLTKTYFPQVFNNKSWKLILKKIVFKSL